MFTGIVLAVGEIAEVRPEGGDTRLTIKTNGLDITPVSLGDSIAVSGACLTVIEKDDVSFGADVSRETLDRTTLGNKSIGSNVNLETSLTLGTPLGGHLVTGHVDGVGTLVKRYEDARSTRLHFEVPKPLAKFIAEKGSVCVDGVSLTVNGVDGAMFDVNIIPHTADNTTLGELQPGAPFNLEVDLVARYVERLRSAD
ncbi:MAG: riboflavin synthase [Pseudomonadota bacterium]